MSDEIAEFLRRAAARRAEQMRQLEQQQRTQQPQPAQYMPPPQPVIPQPRPVLAPVVDAEIIEDEPVTLRPALSSVAQRLDTSGFAVRADRLGDATEQADERMELHLHQAFDHRMGNIAAGTHAITADVTPEVDNEMLARKQFSHPILSMLRQPQSVKNAIILAELLKRPEGNW